MKLTLFILITSLLQVSANSFGQRITLTKSNISVEAVLAHIKSQTGYSILYKDVNLHKYKININVKEASLDEALEISLKGLPFDYKIESDLKVIILKNKKSSIVESFSQMLKNFVSNIDIKGKVVDTLGGPIVGAIVKVKGSNNTTTTNSMGDFALKNVIENAIITISYLGYETKEVKATKNLGVIEMRFLDRNLEEVKINAGYYSVTDKERTGSISRITAKEIGNQPVNNVLAAMQANIPGVQVTQTTGVPGGGFTVQIRGRNSISQGNIPFYVIDGVPFTANSVFPSIVGTSITPNPNPLASINPSDIESVEVLKDADATAIYGSRGANGVILITTKKGKVGEVQTSINYTQGISQVGKKLDLLNIDQYLEMRKEAYFINDKLTTTSSQYSTQYDINGTWSENGNTDWQKKLIGGNGVVTNLQASLSGGAENIRYRIGSNYYKEGMVFPGDHFFSRISGDFNFQYNSRDKKFNASFSANYSQSKNDQFLADITALIFLPPNFPSLLQPDGSLNWENKTMGVNPMANVMAPFNMKSKNLVTSGLLTYSLLPSLKLTANLGYTTTDATNFNSVPSSIQNPSNPSPRSANFGNNSIETWIVEPQINWIKEFGKGRFDILLGTTFQENVTDGQNLLGTGYTSDALLRNIGAASTLTVRTRQYLQYRYTAIFGRLNYKWSEKYILNLTARRDGSSRFGDEKRFANFGAVGGAWILSEEDFMKQFSILNFAKLRGSYGITGNDQIADYGYRSLWGSQLDNYATYQGLSTIYPSALANPDYAWEINKKIEAALELGIFKNRIYLSSGYYYNTSSSQLVGKQLAPTTGFSTIRENLPAKVRNTGWEFVLTTKNISTDNFRWSTSINLTIPDNKLVSYPGLKTSGSNATLYEEGYPLNIKKNYNTYIDAATGLYTRVDFDQNGILDSRDQYIIEFIGRKYYGGIQNNFSYKNFELDFLFQFVKQRGNSGLPSTAPGMFFNFTGTNIPLEMLDRWKNTGDNAKYQKYTTSTAGSTADLYGRIQGSLSTEDASFIRLKNVSLSYRLPSYLTKKITITDAKFFFQGQNLLTFTGYSGLDPENQSLSFLPQLRVYTLGLQITL